MLSVFFLLADVFMFRDGSFGDCLYVRLMLGRLLPVHGVFVACWSRAFSLRRSCVGSSLFD